MSPAQIALDPLIKPLADKGYELSVQHGHLLVLNVPYLDAEGHVRRGTVITELTLSGNTLSPPANHQVWFDGEKPCYANGHPIDAIWHSTPKVPLWLDFLPAHRFSNKPDGLSSFASYADKCLHYITILVDQAMAIDPSATPCTYKAPTPITEASESVFCYEDTASTRAEILALAQKFQTDRVAIIGLGGTGSYIFDLIAKTHVNEIHLFDGDRFEQHNAFRSPGAATREELNAQVSKVHYFAENYAPMRGGIFAHETMITEDNVKLLCAFDFVFVAIDSGPARRIICSFLQRSGIPFIDVGMALMLYSETLGLHGTCRITLSTPEQHDHFFGFAPTHEAASEDLYQANIQVADMNMLNASLAVLRWKQYRTFYLDHTKVHQETFSIFSQSLARSVMTGVAAPCD